MYAEELWRGVPEMCPDVGTVVIGGERGLAGLDRLCAMVPPPDVIVEKARNAAERLGRALGEPARRRVRVCVAGPPTPAQTLLRPPPHRPQIGKVLCNGP